MLASCSGSTGERAESTETEPPSLLAEPTSAIEEASSQPLQTDDASGVAAPPEFAEAARTRFVEEVIVLDVTRHDDEMRVGFVQITGSGQVVRGAGDDRQLRGGEPFTTWQVGERGFEQVHARLVELGAFGPATVPGDFSAGIRVVGTSVEVRVADAGQGSVSTEARAFGDALLELVENASDPGWYDNATEPTPWIPRTIRLGYDGVRTGAEPGGLEWPLERTPEAMITSETGQRSYICVEGEESWLLWTTLFRPGTDWNAITVDVAGQAVGLTATPVFPAQAVANHDLCSSETQAWWDWSSLPMADQVLLSLRAAADGRQSEPVETLCSGLSSDGRPLVASVTDGPGVYCYPGDFDASDGSDVVGYAVEWSDVELEVAPRTSPASAVQVADFGIGAGDYRLVCSSIGVERDLCQMVWEQGLLTVAVSGFDPTGAEQNLFLERNFMNLMESAAGIAGQS